jgi:hypothetical protein
LKPHAAITDVDLRERNGDLALKVNHEATKARAQVPPRPDGLLPSAEGQGLEGAEAGPVKRDPRILVEHVLESIELMEECSGA